VDNSFYEITSINVGLPQELTTKTKTYETSINKAPISERLFLSKLNIDGDQQADLDNHGGEDKAVCVYSLDHYPFWEKELGMKLEAASFGENLTVKGLTEKAVHIGDTFQFGEAVVQVSQPRQPCFKLAEKWNTPKLPLRVQQTGFSGYYFRVLQEGWISKEDGLELIQEHPAKPTIEHINHILYHDKNNSEAIRQILSVDELAESCRKTFLKRKRKI
jgi:MOSC domain-containing protein YiiM